MNLNDIFSFMNNHPICQLATSVQNIPHVRHILLYKADESGILFHTSTDKEMYWELIENNNVEVCFLNIQTFTQIRVSGKAVWVQDDAVKKEILEHPSKSYLRRLKALHGPKVFDQKFSVFKVVQCTGHIWTIETHCDKLEKTAKSFFYF